MKRLSHIELLQFGRNLPAKFIVEINGEDVDVNKVLRLLPNRRVACEVSFKGEVRFAKLFFGKRYLNHFENEKAGSLALEQAGIPTPKLLENLIDTKQSMAVIITEWLDDAIDLDEKLESMSSEELKCEQLTQVVGLIAEMHIAGIKQDDIHLENFLFNEGKFFVIDGAQVDAGAQLSGEEIALKKSLSNLAMFLGQFSPVHDDRIKALLVFYMKTRKLDEKEYSLYQLEQEIFRLRSWREKKYVRAKALRSCSEFSRIQSWTRLLVFSRKECSPDLCLVLEQLPEAGVTGTVLKEGRSATVFLLSNNGQEYVVKHYKKKNWMHYIIRSFLSSRAEVSWVNGHLLRFFRIPTASPIALIEKRFGPLRGESWVVTKQIQGVHSWNFFVEKRALRTEKENVINKLQSIFEALRRVRVSHGDLKPTNILIDMEHNPLLIDLDGMKSYENKDSFYQAYEKDLKRFALGWDNTGEWQDLFDKVVCAVKMHMK